MNKKILGLLAMVLVFGLTGVANATVTVTDDHHTEKNFIDSDAYDPADPRIEEVLRQYDRYYEMQTGQSPWIDGRTADNQLFTPVGGCYRESCAVYIHVKKSEQKAYLYLNGQLSNTWLVSTGADGHLTPNFDRNPNGRIYQKYSSSTYPGGDYNGLGNMPYAVFISGGFAIHGTPKSNWKMLGRRASHGCIRLHPDNAKYFNELVRQAGVAQSWIAID